jgi:hypothetical protein
MCCDFRFHPAQWTRYGRQQLDAVRNATTNNVAESSNGQIKQLMHNVRNLRTAIAVMMEFMTRRFKEAMDAALRQLPARQPRRRGTLIRIFVHYSIHRLCMTRCRIVQLKTFETYVRGQTR